VANTKGISFVNAKAFCDARGSDAWERVLRIMDTADRDQLESVVAVGWYELGLYARLIRAIDAALGSGNLDLVPELGRFEATRDLSTVYRLFFRFSNPAFAIEKSMAYWRRFHDTGSWNITRTSDTSVHGTLTGWGVVDLAMCLELTGYMPCVIELVGGKEPVMTHPRCRSRGADVCVFELEWKK